VFRPNWDANPRGERHFMWRDDRQWFDIITVIIGLIQIAIGL
jgi:hypothetical protein